MLLSGPWTWRYKARAGRVVCCMTLECARGLLDGMGNDGVNLIRTCRVALEFTASLLIMHNSHVDQATNHGYQATSNEGEIGR